MATSRQSFQEFERAGWEDPDIAAGYDERQALTSQRFGILAKQKRRLP